MPIACCVFAIKQTETSCVGKLGLVGKKKKKSQKGLRWIPKCFDGPGRGEGRGRGVWNAMLAMWVGGGVSNCPKKKIDSKLCCPVSLQLSIRLLDNVRALILIRSIQTNGRPCWCRRWFIIFFFFALCFLTFLLTLAVGRCLASIHVP